MESTTRTFGDELTRTPLPACIRVVGGKDGGHLLQQGSCVVGAGHDADLVLEDETVSRRHLELKLVPEGVEVVDLGSRNGTFYLDQRVQHMVLSLGSRIRLGRIELSLDADTDSLQKLPAGNVDGYGSLLGSSPAMRQVYGLLERLEGSLASVLIDGESGTGKELVARMIHERSMASSGPFVVVNCGALDRALIRSELFGHARGAFTGAVEARAGAFEAAANGTLFLDEIGELPLETQPVLLRALETSAVQRVGETAERKVKVRVVAATNRRLEELVRDGKFREDLYYRLLVVRLRLPSLRERPSDVPELVRRFAVELGLAPVADEIVEQFEARAWPGNVRELKNAVHAYAALGSLPLTAAGNEVGLDAALRAAVDLSTPYADLKERMLERFLRVYLELLMQHTGGNQSEASRISGIDRSHLNKLLRKPS